MTAKIIDLNQRRQAKHEQTRDYVFERVQSHIDLLNLEWATYSASNRLNNWISLRVFGDIVEDNYFDLNVISAIEQDLTMSVVVFYPRTFNQDEDCFRAGFHYGQYAIATPPFPREIEARLFNVALYLEVIKDATIKI